MYELNCWFTRSVKFFSLFSFAPQSSLFWREYLATNPVFSSRYAFLFEFKIIRKVFFLKLDSALQIFCVRKYLLHFIDQCFVVVVIEHRWLPWYCKLVVTVYSNDFHSSRVLLFKCQKTLQTSSLSSIKPLKCPTEAFSPDPSQ